MIPGIGHDQPQTRPAYSKFHPRPLGASLVGMQSQSAYAEIANQGGCSDYCKVSRTREFAGAVCRVRSVGALSWVKHQRRRCRRQSKYGAARCPTVQWIAPEFTRSSRAPSGRSRRPRIGPQLRGARRVSQNIGSPVAKFRMLASSRSSACSAEFVELMCERPSLIRFLEAGRGRRTHRNAIDRLVSGAAGGAVSAWGPGS